MWKCPPYLAHLEVEQACKIARKRHDSQEARAIARAALEQALALPELPLSDNDRLINFLNRMNREQKPKGDYPYAV
jgi:hypothetical protein